MTTTLSIGTRIKTSPRGELCSSELTGVGPAMPRKALRIALGGWYMPQTLRSYARQLGLLLSLFALPMLGFVAIARFGRSGSDVSTTLTAGLVGSLGALTVIAGPMVGAFSLAWLGKRWQRVNGELPLLALLPAFGDPACAKLLNSTPQQPVTLDIRAVSKL